MAEKAASAKVHKIQRDPGPALQIWRAWHPSKRTAVRNEALESGTVVVVVEAHGDAEVQAGAETAPTAGIRKLRGGLLRGGTAGRGDTTAVTAVTGDGLHLVTHVTRDDRGEKQVMGDVSKKSRKRQSVRGNCGRKADCLIRCCV